MSKSFRAWDVDQAWLLPPSLHQFVPAGHLAHFVRDTVREALDLSAIIGVYQAPQGQPCASSTEVGIGIAETPGWRCLGDRR